MEAILTAFQAGGTPIAVLVAAALVFRAVWPDVRELLRAATASSKTLAEMAVKSDLRLANIEQTTNKTAEGMVVLLERIERDDRADRRAASAKSVAQGAR